MGYVGTLYGSYISPVLAIMDEYLTGHAVNMSIGGGVGGTFSAEGVVWPSDKPTFIAKVDSACFWHVGQQHWRLMRFVMYLDNDKLNNFDIERQVQLVCHPIVVTNPVN